jgi:hypothetical protein
MAGTWRYELVDMFDHKIEGNWRTCKHEWIVQNTIRNVSYRYQCKKCKVYSYVGPLYDSLKGHSVFLYEIKEERNKAHDAGNP